MTFVVIFQTLLFAQTDTTAPPEVQRVFLHGYVKSLNTVAIPTLNGYWTFDHLIHNRLNFKWNVSENLTLKIEARNRLFFGESIKNNPQFAALVSQSLDYLKLGGTLVQGKSYLLNAFIDRANLDWSKDKWQVVIGKQRINWGRSFVWNPNDIFNAYSFFDFDYEERRGTDALLVKRRLNHSTTLEFAGNLEKDFDHSTLATKYSISKWAYDFQFIAGKYRTDLMAGAGWAGQVGGAGFKGELSYFRPQRVGTGRENFVGDISLDYTLPNTLNLKIEALLNARPQRPTNDFFLIEPVTAKHLTYNYFSLFISAGYDITPLAKAGVSAIWYTDDRAFFLNPTLIFNLSENSELLLAAQVFGGDPKSAFGGLGSYAFARFKWNF